MYVVMFLVNLDVMTHIMVSREVSVCGACLSDIPTCHIALLPQGIRLGFTSRRDNN